MNIEAIEKSIDSEYNGFKIPKSHFKIGSKIHLNDFFYAKKMFQNTFYAHKFAFTAAKYILDDPNFLKKIDLLRRNLSPKYKLSDTKKIVELSLFENSGEITQDKETEITTNASRSSRVAKGMSGRISPDPGISIVGYGIYSELLVNRVERLLELEINKGTESGRVKIPINHDMVSDVEDPRLIMNEKLYNTIIIVVPISTTFSTSYKMLKMLHENYFELDVLGPVINLVLVSHGDLEQVEDVFKINEYLNVTADGNELSKKLANFDDASYLPYKIFKWQHINYAERTVSVVNNTHDEVSGNPCKTISLENGTEILVPNVQRYFITLPNEWHLMNDCRLCYPIAKTSSKVSEEEEKIGTELNEIPLLETDKASVTPNLLFTLPKTHNDIPTFSFENVLLNQGSYRYKHIKREGSDYLHYIDPRVFFNSHRTEITKWCESMEVEIRDKYPLLEQSRILIISPGKQFNAYYTETINRIVFKDRANIIQYEVEGDFIENDKKFFYPDIKTADLIFYADDFCESGRTFHSVNNFVKHCRRESENYQGNNGNYGFNGAFFLISKADQNSFADILSELSQSNTDKSNLKNKYYFSFYNLCVHSLKLPDGRCPVCMELDKYRRLADNSMLETISHYYLNKKINLNPEPPEKGKGEEDKFGFDPLVSDSGELPWIEGNNIKHAAEKWELYKGNKFPDRHYANFLLHHELNLLLRSNKSQCRKILEIQREFNQSEREVIKLEDELEICVKELLGTQSIKKVFQDLWTETNKDLLDDLAYHQTKENFLKILTHPPFVNTISIRQKVFKWVLIEIDGLLNKMIDEYSFKLPTYTEFRYLKFLMRRTTRLGSNYLIRVKTLSKFRKLYKSFGEVYKNLDKQEETFKIWNVVRGPSETDWEKKNEYLQKVENLLQHKKAVLQEFSYYYVALIKELNLDNEAKSIRLDGNVDKLFKGVEAKPVIFDSDPHFYYLLGLLKLENVEVFQQGMNYLAEKYISRIVGIKESAAHFSGNQSATAKDWIVNQIVNELEKADSDYKVENFKRFLLKNQEMSLGEWAKQEGALPYLRCLYIMAFLKVEENLVSNVSLDNKAKAILFNIYRMFDEKLHYNNEHSLFEERIVEAQGIASKPKKSGAFLVVKYNNVKSDFTKPDDLVVVKSTESHLSENDWMTMEIDADNIIYDFMNGLSGREIILSSGDAAPPNQVFKPWTLLELSNTHQPGTKGELWRSDWGKIYKKPRVETTKLVLDTDESSDASDSLFSGFAERLYVPDSTEHMLFFRIADTEEKVEDESLNAKNSIQNTARAAICIYGTKCESHMDITRLLLMLRPELLRFFKKHYETDSLRELVDQQYTQSTIESFGHGGNEFIDELSKVGANLDFDSAYLSRQQIIEVNYDYATFQSKASLVYNDLKNKPLNSDLVIETLNERLMGGDVTELSLKEIGNRFQGIANWLFKRDVFTILNRDAEDVKIKFSQTILGVIVYQVLINIRDHGPEEYEVATKIYFDYQIGSNGGVVIIKISNVTGAEVNPKLVGKINRNFSKRNRHGLGMIANLLKLLNCGYIRASLTKQDDKNLFTIEVTLKEI